MASSKLISSVTHLGVHIFFTKHRLMLDTNSANLFVDPVLMKDQDHLKTQRMRGTGKLVPYRSLYSFQ